MSNHPFLAVFLSCILVLAACSTALPAETLPPSLPSPIPSITVPPLPSPTSWSTRTPLPTNTPTPTPLICWQAGGTLQEISVSSEVLAQPVELLIYLPPCYDQLSGLSYPTLYLIHGQGFPKEQWVQLGLVKTLDEWVASGQSPPVMAVMPQVSNWEEPDSFPFGQALVEEIIPNVENNFRAIAARQARKVGGISRGAGWAFHLGLKYWETFAAFGAHSLPVFFADTPYVPAWLDAIPAEQRPAIFLDYAVSDMSAIRRSTDRFIQKLEERGYPYQFYTAAGVHDQDYWAANLEVYLRFYLEGW